jgi:hypothetical protein
MMKVFVVLASFLVFNCKPRELSLKEFQSFIHDETNGLVKSKEVNGTKVSVSYQPADLWVQQEIEQDVETLSVDSLRKKYSSHYYFIVSLSRNDKEALHQLYDVEEYSSVVQNLSFRIPQYVTLTTDQQDTVLVSDFMLDRTYGLNDATNVLVVFNKQKVNGNKWVHFNLSEFGLGLGHQRFRFSVRELDETPLLAL